MLDKKVVLVGYSGHGLVVAEAAKSTSINLQYYTEIEPVDCNLFNLEYIGFEGEANFDYWNKPLDFILGIGDNTIRKKQPN